MIATATGIARAALGLRRQPPPWRTLGRDRGLVHARPHPRRSRVADAARDTFGAVQGRTAPAMTDQEDA